VPVTGEDLRRLVVATGGAPADLVQWLAPAEVDMTGEPETFVRLPGGRRLMVLAWLAGGCAQLRGDLCGVHQHRPVTCRAYPFHAELGKRDGVRRLKLLDVSECFHTWAQAVPQREVANVARAQSLELKRYARQVQVFNRLQQHRARLGKSLLGEDALFAQLGVS
jgi:Fe-S-cluster containining protein